MNSKVVKLYNIIFPMYMLWVMPPIIFISAILNFIIDSAVVLITEKVLKMKDIVSKYKKVIFKVWGFGFLADFIGAFFLFSASTLFENLDITIKFSIDYNPFGNIYAFIITMLGLIISGVLIYIFNKKICYNKVDLSDREKHILALTMAVLTTPYLFLLPITF